jgi:hypothetical protein
MRNPGEAGTLSILKPRTSQVVGHVTVHSHYDVVNSVAVHVQLDKAAELTCIADTCGLHL